MNYPLKIDDWKTFGKIIQNCSKYFVYYVLIFCPAYISKINLTCEKRIVLLIIANKEGWYYLHY